MPVHGMYAQYIARLKEAHSTANGVFGWKLHYYQFEQLLPKLRASDGCQGMRCPQVISAVFPRVKYLWLTRRDKERQAVSYHRAVQTDGWWQKEGQQPERRPGTVDEPFFDPQGIEHLENLLHGNERGWQRFFEEAHVAPLVIAYEDFAADYDGTIRQILGWLGVESAAHVLIPQTKLKKQADSISEEWVRRYRQFKRQSAAPGSVQVAPTSTNSNIPERWKRWIGENKLANTPDTAIVETLVNNGIPCEAAAAEVARADSNPYLQAGDWMAQRLRKIESLLGVYRSLANLHPYQGEIERRSCVSRAEFLECYYVANRPVILEGQLRDWPAMTRWTPEFFKTMLGREEVEIMAGRNADPSYEINAFEHCRKVLFGEYVDMVHAGGATNDYYLVANNGFFKHRWHSNSSRTFDCSPNI